MTARQPTTSAVLGQLPAVDRIGRNFLFIVVGCLIAALGIGFERSLLVLTLVGIGAAVYGLKNPVIGLMGIGIICTLDALSRVYIMTGGLLRWNTFNYLLLIVILVNTALLLRFSSPHFYLLIALIGVLGLGLTYSKILEDGIQHLLGAISGVGLVVYFLRTRNLPAAWIWLGIICGVLAAMGGLIFFIQRSSLPSINKNSWAFFPLTAIFIVCLAFRAARGNPKLELRLLILALINGIWVFFSASRGSTLIALVCLLYLLKEMRSISQRSLILIAGAGFCLVFSSLFSELNNASVARATDLLDSSTSLADRTSGRTELVRGGWYIFQKFPVFGAGTGSFAVEYAKVSEERAIGFKTGKAVPAHAGWIKVLAENGAIGMIALLLFVGSFAYSGLRQPRNGLGLFGMLVAMVLFVSFLATEFQAKGIWILSAGAMVILQFGFPGGNDSPIEKARSIPRQKIMKRSSIPPRARPQFGKARVRSFTLKRSEG